MRILDLGRARPRRAIAALAISLFLVACGSAAAPAFDGGGGLPAGNGDANAANGGAGSGGGSGSGAGSGTGSGAGAGAGSGTGGGSAGTGNSGTGNSSGGGSAGNGNGAPVLDAARPDLLVIKTGTLALEVADVNAAVAAATTEMAGLGAYVSGSSQAGEGDQVSASITFRIPAGRWEDALIALRSLATKVVTEQTQSDDVTGQIVDLGARVRNLQTTERAIQEVMAKAVTIDEILTVQAELTRIRGEIEQAASAKANLEEQARYSTLTVRFGLPPEAAPSPTPTAALAEPAFDAGAEVGRATESLTAIFQVLATVAIWFGIVWLPVMLTLGAVALGAWWLVRRRLPALTESIPPRT